MIMYLLFFLAGGFIGALLMSLLFSGRREDEAWSEAFEKLEFPHDNPDPAYSVDALVTDAD